MFERTETIKVSQRRFFTISDAVSKFGGYYKAVALPLSFLVSFITLAAVKNYYSRLVMERNPAMTQPQALAELQRRFEVFNIFNTLGKVEEL